MSDLDSDAKKTIAAVVPCYHGSLGNATEIMYLDNGSLLVPRTVKTVLRNTAREFAIDLKAAREKYRKLLNCGRSAPIPLNAQVLLIPLKMRQVVSKNDSSRGYINCFAIKDVKEEGSSTCHVILRDGRTVKCLHSIKNIKQHISNCHFAHQRLSGPPETDRRIALDYLNCPATKSDIAILLKEIREIRENM